MLCLMPDMCAAANVGGYMTSPPGQRSGWGQGGNNQGYYKQNRNQQQQQQQVSWSWHGSDGFAWVVQQAVGQ